MPDSVLRLDHNWWNNYTIKIFDVLWFALPIYVMDRFEN